GERVSFGAIGGPALADRDRRSGGEVDLPVLRGRLRAVGLRQGRAGRSHRGGQGLADLTREALSARVVLAVAGDEPHPGDEGPLPAAARDGLAGPRSR